MSALRSALFLSLAMSLPSLATAAPEPNEEDLSALEEAETDDLPDEAELELARADGEPLEGSELPEQDRPREDLEFDDFYGELSAQGTWVETEEHGWAWVPYRQAEVEDWRPYLYGQWVWTRWGWTWVSEEPFGWATYHYGRWAWTDGWGWSWVPGYTWGPAWVAWRSSDEAIGWAPLYPGYVVYTDAYPFHQSHWVFVGSPFFYCHPIHHHWYHDHALISHHYHRSHWSHHWHHAGASRHRVYAGPTRSHVERSGGTRIRSTRIEPAARTVEQGLTSSGKPGEAPARVSVYRPERRSDVAGASKPRVSVPRASPGARARPVGSGLERAVDGPRARALDGTSGGPGRPGPASVDTPARAGSAVRGGRDGTPSRSGPAVRGDARPRAGGAYRPPSSSGGPSYRRPGRSPSRTPSGGGVGPSKGLPSGSSPGTSPAKPKVGKSKKKPSR